MITRTSWKFLPLAAFLALASLVFASALDSPRTALADVTNVTAAETAIASGGETDITVTLNTTNGGSSVIITAEGADAATTATLAVVDCNPNCTSEEGESGETITIQQDNVTQVSLTLTADCEGDDTITVTADQGAGASDSVTVACSAPNITIVKTATGAGTVEFDFTSTGSSTECDLTFKLIHQGSTALTCDEPGTYTITETAETGFNLSSIECDENGEANATVTLADRKVVIELTDDADDDDSVVCTFTNVGSTPTVGSASTLTASASPNSVGCNASSFVTLTLKDAAGAAVANGTSITVSVAGGGSVNPTTTTTTGGGALILYTAPSTGSGTSTITATAGTAVGSTTVQFACAAAQATTAPPPPPATPAQIAPPNTGDAGLADQASRPASMALALVLSVVIGALAAKRVRT